MRIYTAFSRPVRSFVRFISRKCSFLCVEYTHILVDIHLPPSSYTYIGFKILRARARIHRGSRYSVAYDRWVASHRIVSRRGRGRDRGKKEHYMR